MQEYVFLLSMVPGIEAMWTSSYFFYYNQLIYIPLCVLLNFMSVLIFIKIADRGSLPKRVERFLERRKEKAVKKAEKLFQKYGNIVLFFLIALPLTGVGSYTGAFIGRVFGLKGISFYLMILSAVSLSVVFSFLIVKLFNIMFLF